MMQTVTHRGTGLFIAGTWREPAATYRVSNPYNGEFLADVAEGSPAEVDAAVQSGLEAWSRWRLVSAADRAAKIEDLAQRISEHAEALAQLDAADGGNPIGPCRVDIAAGVRLMRYMAGLALQIKGETIPTSGGELDYTLRQPYGVVARIMAFNHPAYFAMAALASPLVAGNTVVLKPSPHTPLSAMWIAEIAGEVLPPGVINLVTGGADAAVALARHPQVHRLALTGSVAAALALTRVASETNIKSISLELGGKNPMVVLPDSDIDAVADGAVKGMNFRNSAGQSCVSTSRLFAHASIHDRLVDAVADRMGSLRLGNPLDTDTEVGPLVSEAQRDRTERLLGMALDDGARLVVGGGRPDQDDLANGWFFRPTLIRDVAPPDRIAQEEVFGPLLSVLSWSDQDEVVRAANSTPYGLSASIWTNDLERAITLARDIQSGYVWVNNAASHQLGAPFGGYRNSGVGRELSIDELLSYTQIKNVNISFQPTRAQ